MNGYRVLIWRAVYHGSGWSHNSERIEIIHARTMAEARTKAEAGLQPGHEDEYYRVSPEFIYSITYLGYIRYRRAIEYIPAKKRSCR